MAKDTKLLETMKNIVDASELQHSEGSESKFDEIIEKASAIAKEREERLIDEGILTRDEIRDYTEEEAVAIGEDGGDYNITLDDFPDEMYDAFTEEEWAALMAAEANERRLLKLQEKKEKAAKRLHEYREAQRKRLLEEQSREISPRMTYEEYAVQKEERRKEEIYQESEIRTQEFIQKQHDLFTSEGNIAKEGAAASFFVMNGTDKAVIPQYTPEQYRNTVVLNSDNKIIPFAAGEEITQEFINSENKTTYQDNSKYAPNQSQVAEGAVMRDFESAAQSKTVEELTEYKKYIQHTKSKKTIGAAMAGTQKLGTTIKDALLEEDDEGKAGEAIDTLGEGVKAAKDAAYLSKEYLQEIGTGYSYKELTAIEKVAIDELQKERVVLSAKLNKELRVSGNVAGEIKTVDDVNRLLQRMDISDEARQTATSLKEKMEKISLGTEFAVRNGKELVAAYAGNEKVLKERYGVSDVRQLDIKQIDKLRKAELTNEARILNAIKNEVGKDTADFLKALGITDLKELKKEKVAELLAGKKISSDMAKKLDALVSNVEKQELLLKRYSFLRGGDVRELGKDIKNITSGVVIGKIKRYIREDSNLAIIADSHDTYRNIKMAQRASKAIYDKSLVKVGVKKAQKAVAESSAGQAGKAMVQSVKDGFSKTPMGEARTVIKKKAEEKVIAKETAKNTVRATKQSNRALRKAKRIEKLEKHRTYRAYQKAKAMVGAGVRKITGSKAAVAAKKAASVVSVPLKFINSGTMKVIGAIASLFSTILVGFVVIFTVVMMFLTVFATSEENDVNELVKKINDYREEVVVEAIYDGFKGETDPLGNPYGYVVIDEDGNVIKKSDDISSGVTFNFASGVHNNTAEIISLAAVYYNQNWPDTRAIQGFFDADTKNFLKFIKILAEYGMDITAQESDPYSCITMGGCKIAYRSEGDIVSIPKWKQEKYWDSHWVWSVQGTFYPSYESIPEDKKADASYVDAGSYKYRWVRDGSQDVRVYWNIDMPDGASTLEWMSEHSGHRVSNGGSISSGSALDGGAIVIADQNVFAGREEVPFHTPGELSASFDVVFYGDNDNKTQRVTVTCNNMSKHLWCPGELHDDLHGHYDLDVQVHLIGWDEYEPIPTNEELASETEPGTGTLKALAKYMTENGDLVTDADGKTTLKDIQITRIIKKLNKDGNEYSTSQSSTSGKVTKTLPKSAPGDDELEVFDYWYDANGEDSAGMVEWACSLFSQDWADVYGVTEGIKTRLASGQIWSAEEIAMILSTLEGVSEERKAVVAIALGYEGRLGYSHAKPTGGPGNVSIGTSTDCSGFVQLCFWKAGHSFSAVNTVNYKNASDLREISPSQVQPGDMWVVDPAAAAPDEGHVMLYIGAGNWLECNGSLGGVVRNKSNEWMQAHASTFYSRF